MQELLKMLLVLTLGGGAVSLLLLMVKGVLGRHLPSSFYYYAWLLVLFRFLLPIPGVVQYERVSPGQIRMLAAAPSEGQRPAVAYRNEGGWNVQETVPEESEQEEPEQELFSDPGVADVLAPQELPQVDSPADPEMTPPVSRQEISPAAVAVGIWATGVAATWLVFGVSYGMFIRRLNRTLRPARMEEQRLFRSLKAPRRLTLCRSSAVSTPMQLGLFRPKLVLPQQAYTEEMLAHILRHELTHYQRRDILYKWFAVSVSALHWFNPVLWLIRRELDQECELSCDERLLKTMTTEEKRSYGETLLALAASRSQPRRVVATSFATEKRNLKERLEKIMTYQHIGKNTVALILCVLIMLCSVALAAGPARAEEITGEPDPAPTYMPEQTDSEPADGENSSQVKGLVYVHTVDEFLEAIAPDANIVLGEGDYNLSNAASYPKKTNADRVDSGEYYYWENLYDGFGLVITGVTGLTIQAEENAQVQILAVPRYADVLRFEGCDGITVANITAGHTTEPSNCAGAVLVFNRTDNVVVDSCRLFGCGTWGVTTENCRNVLVTGSHIYECSLGAVMLSSSWNVQVDNCEIYDCFGYDGLFHVDKCGQVAFTNSTISNNRAGALVYSRNHTSGLFLGGLLVEANRFSEALYVTSDEPMVFTGCEIAPGNVIPNGFAGKPLYSESDAEAIRAVNPEGEEMSDADIGFLNRQQVKWKAQERIAAAAKAPDADGMIHVSNVEEFLAAIGSDRTIYLEPGTYSLTTASNYGQFVGDYYSWSEDFDGYSLTLEYISGLTIEGAGADQVVLETLPRYADVLRLENCSDVILRGFTAGHTVEQGSCSGDVLGIENCQNIQVDSCSLFGCGVRGIDAMGCDSLSINATEIHHCEMDAAVLFQCRNVTFSNCSIHDNGADQVIASACINVVVNGASIS